MTFNPDSGTLAVATEGEITLWDVHIGRLLGKLRVHTGGGVFDALGGPTLAWHPDGRTLAVGWSDKQIQIWGPDASGVGMPAELGVREAPNTKLAPRIGEPATADNGVEEEIERFAGQLQKLMLGEGKESSERLRDTLGMVRAGTIERIIDEFKDASTNAARRSVLAHVLGQSWRPEAIEALRRVANDAESGVLARCLAAQALAYSDARELDPILLALARDSLDTGVRANASFGLWRRGNKDGIALYFAVIDAVFERQDPEAARYLAGVRVMGDKAWPGIRERLLSYRNEQALLALIAFVQASGDKAASEALGELAGDEAKARSVRDAARGALESLK
jgi:hypothetical protein